MNSIKHISLLQKRLSGAMLSEEEQKLLTQWLEASEENRSTSEELQRIWNTSSDLYDDYTPSVKEGWEKVQSKIDNAESLSRDNIKSIKPRFNILRIAAVFILLLGLGVVFTWMNTSEELMMASTGLNEQKQISLSDGSSIILNENSSLQYPATFGKDARNVVLQGEAFFEISKNPDAPFNIETARSNVSVLGTSFNVRAYANEAITEVTVKTGRVKFRDKTSNKAVVLSQHQSASLNHEENRISSLSGNSALNELSWFSNRMTFRNTTLLNVKKAVEQHFNIQLVLSNELQNCPFSASFDLEKQSLEDVLEAIKIVFQVQKIENQNEIYQLIGGQCN